MSESASFKSEPQLGRSLFSISWPIFIDLGMHFATLMINMIMVGFL